MKEWVNKKSNERLETTEINETDTILLPSWTHNLVWKKVYLFPDKLKVEMGTENKKTTVTVTLKLLDEPQASYII